MVIRDMDIGKRSDKHPADISEFRPDEMDVEIEKGYLDMLAGRTIPAQKVFTDIRCFYRKTNCPEIPDGSKQVV